MFDPDGCCIRATAFQDEAGTSIIPAASRMSSSAAANFAPMKSKLYRDDPKNHDVWS